MADGVGISVSVSSVRVLSKPRTNLHHMGFGGGNSSCNARSSPPLQPQMAAAADGCDGKGRGEREGSSTRLRTFEEKLDAKDEK